jgi:hypothetical protein
MIVVIKSRLKFSDIFRDLCYGNIVGKFYSFLQVLYHSQCIFIGISDCKHLLMSAYYGTGM